jgi:hypothetical protein
MLLVGLAAMTWKNGYLSVEFNPRRWDKIPKTLFLTNFSKLGI